MSVQLAATVLANGGDFAPAGYSPQHVNNWTIEVIGFIPGGDPLSLGLSRGFMPSVGVDEVAIPFGNETVYVAGRANYEGGQIEIRDYVDVDTQGLLRDWFERVYSGVREMTNGRVGVPRDYKRRAFILFTAPDGSVERRWQIRGLWPSRMNFGGLDMSSSEQVQVTVTCRYDKAIYQGQSGAAAGQ